MINWIILFLQLVLMIYCIKDIWSSKFRDASAKALWVAIVVLLPLFGSVAYLQNRKNLKAARKWRRGDNDIVF